MQWFLRNPTLRTTKDGRMDDGQLTTDAFTTTVTLLCKHKEELEAKKKYGTYENQLEDFTIEHNCV